jgi:organic radical activating enzyme
MNNHTIVVNWSKRTFGCTKNCSYCNWREHPDLPHGLPDWEDIGDFISGCNKTFITISGGGDPLWKFKSNHGEISELLSYIKASGKKTRIITREIEWIHFLRDLDYVSISLDNNVLDRLSRYQHLWGGIEVEYSLVLPPLPANELIKLLPQYKSLQTKLQKRLVLRENLNSIFEINFREFNDNNLIDENIVFVNKYTCLESIYLTKYEMKGTELFLDMAQLYRYLNFDPDIFLFGSIYKHLVDPIGNIEFNDIDIIITNLNVLETLWEGVKFKFEESSNSASYPRYFKGKSPLCSKEIHVVYLHDIEEVKKFIFNNQYDVDRVFRNKCQTYLPEGIDKEAIANNIRNKIATKLPREDQTLFHISRKDIENAYRLKLLKKGWTIHE